MSYDLTLLPKKDQYVTPKLLSDLKARLGRADVFRFCEILDHEYEPPPPGSELGEPSALFTVCLTRDAEVAEEAFAQLKLIAAEYRLTLEDPQAGGPINPADAERLSPMYGEPKANAPEPGRRPWWRFWEASADDFVVVTVTDRRPWWRLW